MTFAEPEVVEKTSDYGDLLDIWTCSLSYCRRHNVGDVTACVGGDTETDRRRSETSPQCQMQDEQARLSHQPLGRDRSYMDMNIGGERHC